jgi:hypothetical protein
VNFSPARGFSLFQKTINLLKGHSYPLPLLKPWRAAQNLCSSSSAEPFSIKSTDYGAITVQFGA